MIYRHGDVILEKAALPKKAKTVFTGKAFVAQEGETTGHKHMVRTKDIEFTVSTVGDLRYFTFPEAATITHEEHKQIVVEPGTYKQVQEREVDWFSQTTRKVVD